MSDKNEFRARPFGSPEYAQEKMKVFFTRVCLPCLSERSQGAEGQEINDRRKVGDRIKVGAPFFRGLRQPGVIKRRND